MTGDGRCQRRRKVMDRGTDGGCVSEEFPAPAEPSEVSEAGGSEFSGVDLYCQASKALSLRSPFDSAEALATTVPTLPSVLGGGLLARQSDGRKRHKKSHTESKSSKQAVTERPKSSSIWAQYEEYFRELTVSDIDMLQKWSASFELLVSDSCLSIPFVGNSVRDQVNNGHAPDASDASGNAVKREISASEASLDIEPVIDKLNEQPMEVDYGDGAISHRVAQESTSSPVPQESTSPRVEQESFSSQAAHKSSPPQQLHSISSLEWVLGSRNKIMLTTDRPTKKRKLLGESAGLQRLLVAKCCQGMSRICHFCSLGDSGDQLNQLVVCSSCEMCVHQKCYGVQGDVDESWVCSWCKWNVGAEAGPVSGESGPCVLCSKPGGALKPVRGAVDADALSMKFAHLFCSLWMPEVYVDDMRMMEPIMNVDRIKETRRKLICNLCKVRHGTCVRCTDGACRTSFHPICAREAGHRLEVWGKLGCDDVELRAFCSKHSPQGGSPFSEHGHSSLLDNPFADDVSGKGGDRVADCFEKPDGHSSELGDAEPKKNDLEGFKPNDKCGTERTDVSDLTGKDSQGRSTSDVVNPPDALHLPSVLKKLIDRDKISLNDLASDIGVPADSLAANLADGDLPPDLHCKLTKWLGDHAFIATSHKKLTLRISVPSKVSRQEEDESLPAAIKDSDTFDVPVKSVPPRRRTVSSVRTLKDNNSLSSSKDNFRENGGLSDEVLAHHVGFQGSSSLLSPISGSFSAESIKLEKKDASGCSASDSVAEEAAPHSVVDVAGPCIRNMGFDPSSYVHPYIQKKVTEMSAVVVKKSSGVCSDTAELNSHTNQSSKSVVFPKCNDDGGSGVTLDGLFKAKEMGILDLRPEDEVEGELVHFQHWLFSRAAKRKQLSEDLISKIVKNLPLELEMVRRQRWDSVLVHQYLSELREAKRQGRKEKKYKEAQAILAAAAAAAAASSRTSLRKDGVDEASHQQDTLKMQTSRVSLAGPRVKETASFSAVSRNASAKQSDTLQLASKEHQRSCDVCGRMETILKPILICSSCKVAVHLDCYRNVKESAGPWYCEFCDAFPAKPSNSLDKPASSIECGLCGNANGAFRKSSSGQWVHAICAEWLLESSFRRGQVNPIEGMESIVKEANVCSVCHRSSGVCLKCNAGQCHSTFHPYCARAAGYYMSVQGIGGKLQHRAFCSKHSIDQRSKIEGQKHGVEELKSLKQVRVELEKLRLICERIVKREKLKREAVMCSHDLLASKRDTLAFSPLFQGSFPLPEASSESATTSLRGHTDCSISYSESMQKSDDVTVDSTVSGKRRIKLLISSDPDQRTDDSSTSQQIPTPRPKDRVSFSGKHLPLRPSLPRRNIHETGGKKLKSRKPTETFEKELTMTSDQASMKNKQLPKGYIYVPMDRLSTEDQASRDSQGGGNKG